jgi:arylsulfatase A-like enzyme
MIGLMSKANSAPSDRTVSSDVCGPVPAPRRLGALDVLLLSVWCGLAAGLLEVGVRILGRVLDPRSSLYLRSRHFVWMVPLSNLLLFSLAGLFLAAATRLWPRRGGWLCPRLIGFWAALPVLSVSSARVYPVAWAVLALGIAMILARALERQANRLRWRLLASFPGLLVLVLVSAGSVFGGDWLKLRREAGHPLPAPDSPNVLLVVLDTVRADHLSLHGHERPTSPNLERLAQRGIQFDEARATAPWTLASHASFLTGRWPHELEPEWMTPLHWSCPTLAEFLGASGYATAGFVANTLYCSYDTGLDRGFTHYQDYVPTRLGLFRTAWLVDRALLTTAGLGLLASRSLGLGVLPSWFDATLQPLLEMDRKKDASEVNREFLGWLSRRAEPGRPFFAFLNYYDAHAPYVLPQGGKYRFGLPPQDQTDFRVLVEEWQSIHDKPRLPPRYLTLARDCYDSCLAYLDEQLGTLFDELERRGVLDRTAVIVVADHGEGLGEHELFDHGESLYRTEIRVPLLVVLPSQSRSHRVVAEPVSLRDLPATIVDLLGLGTGSPFPGRSLARFWREPPPEESSRALDGVISELKSPNPSDPNHGRSPAYRGPLISLAMGDYVYILNQGDGTEELYNQSEDPRELLNRAGDKAMQPLLRHFRRQLDRLNPGSSHPVDGSDVKRLSQ